MPAVNYPINVAPLREQLQERNAGGKPLLQLLLKIG